MVTAIVLNLFKYYVRVKPNVCCNPRYYGSPKDTFKPIEFPNMIEATILIIADMIGRNFP